MRYNSLADIRLGSNSTKKIIDSKQVVLHMSEVYYQTVTSNEVGQRIDNYLLRILKGVPKSHVYRLIRGGEVRVNKKRVKPSQRLVEGDSIRIPPVRRSDQKVVFVGQNMAQSLNECVMHEDDELMVLNKPTGLAVHGGSGVHLGVIEALREMRGELGYLELAHRLDKETSGCLLLAKKRAVLRALQDEFASRRVMKIYWALLAGHWHDAPSRLVEGSLEKQQLGSGERKVYVSDLGRASETRFNLLENYQNACWVEAMPKTGRTHQIRVHAASIGHPVLGDAKYGRHHQAVDAYQRPNRRLYLHARAIRFNLNGVAYEFLSEVDDEYSSALNALRLHEGLSQE